MSLILNEPEFWIYKSSEYASGFEYVMILNILEFWICHRVTQGSEYTWIILEYARICVNMTKSVWMAFALHFLTSPFALQSLLYLNTWLPIWTSSGDIFRRLEVIVWRNIRLFSWSDKIWFSLEQLELFHLIFILD